MGRTALAGLRRRIRWLAGPLRGTTSDSAQTEDEGRSERVGRREPAPHVDAGRRARVRIARPLVRTADGGVFSCRRSLSPKEEDLRDTIKSLGPALPPRAAGAGPAT